MIASYGCVFVMLTYVFVLTGHVRSLYQLDLMRYLPSVKMV